MKKKFVTIFPEINGDDYYRDPCMLPWIMSKYFNYDSFLIFVKQDSDYSAFEKYLPELKLVNISSEKSIYNYIRENAQNIDVLNLFFLSIRKSMKWAEWYKKYNAKGIVYIKLDMSYPFVSELANDNLKNILKRIIIKKKLKYIDFLSVETTKVKDVLEKLLNRRVLYIPDGYYSFEEIEVCKKKNNEILTVGALGTEAKNTELLIQAFAKSKVKNEYKLHLVGTVTPELENMLVDLFYRDEQLKNQVILDGPIMDRKRLFNVYEKARVFAFPSRWESFGFALLEAATHGCYIITTNAVPLAEDLINDSRQGCIFESENEDELVNIFNSLSNRIKKFDEYEQRVNLQKFWWPTVCSQIDKRIKERQN